MLCEPGHCVETLTGYYITILFVKSSVFLSFSFITTVFEAILDLHSLNHKCFHPQGGRSFTVYTAFINVGSCRHLKYVFLIIHAVHHSSLNCVRICVRPTTWLHRSWPCLRIPGPSIWCRDSDLSTVTLLHHHFTWLATEHDTIWMYDMDHHYCVDYFRPAPSEPHMCPPLQTCLDTV